MIRGVAVVGICSMLFVLGLQQAEAKTIDISYVSRGDVRNACLRVRGSSFGIEDETAAYGCSAGPTTVACTADGQCQATVEDTRPLLGNSLGYLLGFGPPSSGAHMIVPQDARVTTSGYYAQTGTYTPIQPITGPSTLPPWAPPFTDPYAPKPY